MIPFSREEMARIGYYTFRGGATRFTAPQRGDPAGGPARLHTLHADEGLVTDKLLKGMCAQVANMAKTELTYRHELNGIIAVYVEGEGLHRMRKVERLIEREAGIDWMNSGRVKEAVFGILSYANSIKPADAIVIATAGDEFVPTEKLLALPEEEIERIYQGATHPRQMPEYFTPRDVLLVVAQNEERVCTFKQRLAHGNLLIGEPDVFVVPQAEFEGRLKLFGVDPPAELTDRIRGKFSQKHPF